MMSVGLLYDMFTRYADRIVLENNPILEVRVYLRRKLIRISCDFNNKASRLLTDSTYEGLLDQYLDSSFQYKKINLENTKYLGKYLYFIKRLDYTLFIYTSRSDLSETDIMNKVKSYDLTIAT